MSFKATEWSYGLRGLSGTEKAVLNNLAWHHNGKTGLCCPSTSLIVEETGFEKSTVNKAIRSLEGKGLISRYPWKGRSAYMLAIVEPQKATTEPAHIEQEETKKPKASNWDWKKRQDKPAAPMSDFRAIAEKRAAEFRSVIEPTVKDRGSPEERAAVVARALGLWREPDDHPGQSPGSRMQRETEAHKWRGGGESARSPGLLAHPSRRL